MISLYNSKVMDLGSHEQKIEISVKLYLALTGLMKSEVKLMWNIDNPTEKTTSLYKKLQNFILAQAISGKCLCDAFEKDYSRKAISTLARDLYVRNKVERTRFKTKEGHIYGKSLKDCLEYGIKKRLIPKGILGFFKVMIGKGFITNQQLIYEYGFEIQDMNWIYKRLIKTHYFNVKESIKNKLYIYYCPGLDPKKYERTEEFNKWLKWIEDFPERIKQEGSWFEDYVEKIYQGFGFQTVRNRWYRIDEGNFEVDIVAWKEESLGIRTIYISCKKYQHSIVTSYDLLRMVTFRKLLKRDYGEIHIWCWGNIAKSVFDCIPAFPFVRIFYKKHFMKMCDELGIEIPIEKIYNVRKST